MSEDVGAEDNEEWLRQYLHDYITLEQAGAVAGGISREAIRLRLKKLGMTPRTSAETLRLRELRETSAHATTIRETFYATRSESQVSAATGLPASAIRRFLDREIPDWTIVAGVARDVRKRFSEIEMLDSLRDASQGSIVPLTVNAYRGFLKAEPALADGRPRPGVQGMMLRFGSWNAAVRAAGLPANPHSGPAKEFDAAGAVTAVADCWRELGRPPSVRAYELWQTGRPGYPSSATIRKLLSSWPSVQIRAWQLVHGVVLDQDDQDVAIPTSETGPTPLLPEYQLANPGAVVSLPAPYEAGEYNALERAVRSHARIQNGAASVGGEELLEWTERLQRVCEEHGTSMAAAALHYSLRSPMIDSTVVGVSSPHRREQLDELVQAEVPDELWGAIESLGPAPSPVDDSDYA